MAFERAEIPIEKAAEFNELRGVVQRVFGPGRVEKFFKKLRGRDLKVRDFESILARGFFEALDETLAKSGKTAQGLYQSLPVSDQAQMREFYLTTLELVDDKLRHKFHEIYRCH